MQNAGVASTHVAEIRIVLQETEKAAKGDLAESQDTF